MKMPKVTTCDMTECSYNSDQKCHALAITVGDTTCPCCDTFTDYENKGGDQSTVGGVGACRATDCKFNESLECSAPGIKVGHAHDHADCLTFSES